MSPPFRATNNDSKTEQFKDNPCSYPRISFEVLRSTYQRAVLVHNSAVPMNSIMYSIKESSIFLLWPQLLHILQLTLNAKQGVKTE